MASAYKSALRPDVDTDESMSVISDQSAEDAGETSSAASEDEGEQPADHRTTKTQPPSQSKTTGELRNRILMLTSRGVSFRHRHLLTDLCHLLPHTYKDTKLDTKSNNNYNAALNGLADLHSCNYIFFLEGRKQGQDLYLWLAKAPNGPTIKFHVSNVHTMGELGFGGNVLKGGRGIVAFDKSFDTQGPGGEHKEMIREVLRGVFCVPPKGVRGMKPFIDRVTGIYGLDGKIWVRVYEIRNEKTDGRTEEKSGADISLVEVGPRMVLTPIVILEGSFGGPVIFENRQYVSPNQIRQEARTGKAATYAKRRGAVDELKIKRKTLGMENGMRPKSSLDNSVLFG